MSSSPTVDDTGRAMWPASNARRRGRGDFRLRFGLSRQQVSPVFTTPPAAATTTSPSSAVLGGRSGLRPRGLVIYAPHLGRAGLMRARLGAARTVVVTSRARPLSAKAVACVGGGAIAGMMLAQPFDPVTILAPVCGLLAGGACAGAGWLAVRGRGSITIWVDQWHDRLELVRRVLCDAEQIGQPFVSPAALRDALHSSLWHAAHAVGQPAEAQVLGAFDDQLGELARVTGSTLVELESPTIEARKSAATGRLAAAIDDMVPLLAALCDGDADATEAHGSPDGS